MFDSMAAFGASHEKAVAAAYGVTLAKTPIGDKCYIWGRPTEVLKAATAASTNPVYHIGKSAGGFIRGTGNGIAGPPIFFFSKRTFTSTPAEYSAAFQGVADYWFSAVPGLIGAMGVFCDDEDPQAVWDLRVFSNFADGFAAHFAMAHANALDKLVALLGTGFKIVGSPLMLASAGEPEKMVAGNPANGVYTPYIWGQDNVGAMVDLTKDD